MAPEERIVTPRWVDVGEPRLGEVLLWDRDALAVRLSGREVHVGQVVTLRRPPAWIQLPEGAKGTLEWINPTDPTDNFFKVDFGGGKTFYLKATEIEEICPGAP